MDQSKHYRFQGFSPFTRPNVIEVADGLVIVDAEEEVEGGVTHDPGPGA